MLTPEERRVSAKELNVAVASLPTKGLKVYLHPEDQPKSVTAEPPKSRK